MFMGMKVSFSKVAIILGNGPSLRGFDFAKELDGLDSFGMNAAYRHWHKIGWYPTYYACCDSAICSSHKTSIEELVFSAKHKGISKFLLRTNIARHLKEGLNDKLIVDFDFWMLKNKDNLFKVNGRYINAYNTGTASVLWAFHLGYKKIILLGVDGKYVQSEYNESEVAVAIKKQLNVMKAASSPCNSNYFFNNYQESQDLFLLHSNQNEYHFQCWENLYNISKKIDISILNATPQSSINFFKKIDWKAI